MARGGECRAQDISNSLRFIRDLLFAEPNHLETSRAQLQITGSVVLKGLAAPVVAIAICFYDQPPITPEEVDEMAANANVDLGDWQSLPPAKPQEVRLEIAAGPISLDLGPEQQTEDLRLANSSPHLPRRRPPSQIANRPRRSRDRNPESPRGLPRAERHTTMKTDASAFRASTASGGRHVYGPFNRPEETPQRGRASVAQNGILTACQNRS